MATISLNALQFRTLWLFLQTQGKGGPHLRRMDRLMHAFDIEAIEAKIDEAQDQLEILRASQQAIPRALLNANMRANDPPFAAEVNDGDLDKAFHRVTSAWGKETEPDQGKQIDPVCQTCARAREVQDPRIHLPILDELTRAWNEVCAARASKTDGENVARGDAPAADTGASH